MELSYHNSWYRTFCMSNMITIMQFFSPSEMKQWSVHHLHIRSSYYEQSSVIYRIENGTKLPFWWHFLLLLTFQMARKKDCVQFIKKWNVLSLAAIHMGDGWLQHLNWSLLMIKSQRASSIRQTIDNLMNSVCNYMVQHISCLVHLKWQTSNTNLFSRDFK